METTEIARCPEHGLHGDRHECFVCGGPVERVPMVEASALSEALALLTEAYPGEWPTNRWRERVEALGAWPPPEGFAEARIGRDTDDPYGG